MTQPTIDATERVRTLIELTENLSEIFGKENQLLADQRPLEIAPLQAEKARLAAAYAQSIRDVAANRAIVQDADSALLLELRAITKSFEARAAVQRSLLDGAQRAAEGVVKAVAEEAAAQDANGYSNGPEGPAKATPISINESA